MQVFWRNQEPGEILNNIQRCSARFLQSLEEKDYCDIETNVKLFSAFIYFSSPSQRVKFRDSVEKYLDKCENFETFLVLKKILSYVKISDKNVCIRYWNLSLKFLDETDDVSSVIRLCQNYVSFHTDVANFRHYEFEMKMLKCIENIMNSQELVFHPGIITFLSFILKYQSTDKLLHIVISKLEMNVNHVQSLSYLQLIETLRRINDQSIPPEVKKRLGKVMNDIHGNLIQTETNNFWENTLLAKAMTLQNCVNSYTFENLMYKFKEIDSITSRMIEGLCSIFILSSSIIPEVLNKCTEYIINNPKYIVGFNAEKVLYVCYYLAYYPLNHEKFFGLVTDIILR